MIMRNSRITFKPEYKGLPLWNNYKVNTGFYTDILDRTLELLEHMISRHSQVLVIRLDVRFPLGYIWPDDNSLFQGFIENYRRRLSDWGYDAHLLWAREQKTSPNPHYHCFILLNGNKIRYFKNTSKADELWARALNLPLKIPGLIQICPIDKYYSKIIHQNNSFEFAKIFKALSYLAKVATKLKTPKHTRMFGCSQRRE